MFSAFPKIWTLGSIHTERLFNGKVQITEKVDGSQFAFGYDREGKFRMRSKGAEIQEGAPPKLFQGVHDMAIWNRNKGNLDTNAVYYGEAVQSPRHNILNYSRVPLGNFVLFGVLNYQGELPDYWYAYHHDLANMANRLQCEVVPLLYEGSMPDGINKTQLDEMMARESFLGGPSIEGIVIKNWGRAYDYKGLVFPLTAAKFVSEKFKERLDKEWKGIHTTKGKWEDYKESFRTEARWHKAIQRATEAETLLRDVKDIGPLIQSIMSDVTAEEKENIKETLWNLHKDELLKKSIAGFPQWYKEKLAIDMVTPIDS